MMRWNNTKTYTEDDMMRMQQEAVSRVHEFQSRARQPAVYELPPSAVVELPSPDSASPPDELSPPSAAYGQEPGQTGESGQTQLPQASQGQGTPPGPTDPLHKILSSLNVDNETLLIMGLMFLLYNEKADNVLLLALAYLLL